YLRDRNVININVLLANQVEQQVQRSFVNIGHGNRKREIALLFFLGRLFCLGRSSHQCGRYNARISRNEFCLFTHQKLTEGNPLSSTKLETTPVLAFIGYSLFLPVRAPGASYFSDIPIAARTSSMVLPDAARARCVPASRISHASRGLSSNFFLRSCIGLSNCTSESAAQLLHSMQPMPAVRQPSLTLAIVSLLLKILCRSPTGQTSGLPGSDRRTRAGSVTMVFSFCRTTGSGSASMMVFPYDFDILRPSVPGSLAAGVSKLCGSGKTLFAPP